LSPRQWFREMSFVPRQRVLFVLATAAIMCCTAGGFVDEAPNRLVSGAPFALWQTGAAPGLWLALGGLVLVVLSIVRNAPATRFATLGLALILLLLLLFTAGDAATGLMAAAPPAARISLGWAFW